MNKIIDMTITRFNGNEWIQEKETRQFERLSNWIKIKKNYNPNKRNALWYYVTDGNGNRENNDNFSRKNGLYLDYFTFRGKKYALEQFLSLNNPFFMPFTYHYENKDGKYCYLSAVDSENYYNPLFLEIDEYCEYIRIYQEL